VDHHHPTPEQAAGGEETCRARAGHLGVSVREAKSLERDVEHRIPGQVRANPRAVFRPARESGSSQGDEVNSLEPFEREAFRRSL
jgi:hypothetical protein